MADRRSEMFHQGQMSAQYNMGQSQPPRYSAQQIMGNMMRPMNPNQTQMMGQTGPMMSRPPPPDYRQTALLQQQQQQAMMAQPMPQAMGHMPQGMSQMAYQRMRPGMGGGPMSGGPMTGMPNTQIMGMNQQNLPPNMPNMKGGISTSSSMNSNMAMSSQMGQGSMGPGTMPVTSMGTGTMSNGMGQSGVGGSTGPVGMVGGRPTMTGGAMMQRARPPNVNVGMPNMGTQMPPSRPEWRQIMVQGQGPIMMGPGMRPYQQSQQGKFFIIFYFEFL